MLRNDMLIQAEQLTPALTAFEYEGNALDIAIRRGEIVSLIGPDYSGKSDWLRTLTGVNTPRSGVLHLLGKTVDSFTRADWVETRKQLAYVKSDNTILSAANALQNVMLPASYHHVADSKTLRTRATRLLTELGIFDLISLPAFLRKDQRFRIAIARALILQPAALALDNPFVMLDAIAAETLQHYLIRRVQEQNMALLILTHNIEFALKVSDQILFITPSEVLRFDRQHRIQDCDKPFVQNFINKKTPC